LLTWAASGITLEGQHVAQRGLEILLRARDCSHLASNMEQSVENA
jgi:hypothetical protein